MGKGGGEVKIAEKIKFWEEQDRINKELIPRVVKNHEMITDLTYQFEQSLKSIASLRDDADKLNKKMDSLKQLNAMLEQKVFFLSRDIESYENLEKALEEQERQIEELKNLAASQQQQIEEIKRVIEKKGSNRLIYAGIVAAFLLSIIGIIL